MSSTQTLIDSFFLPETSPDTSYAPDKDVTAWIEADGLDIVLEVFKRSDSTFGFRYKAWVAWRDAGDLVRSHSWHRIHPETTLFAVSETEARCAVENHAKTKGIQFVAEWRTTV